MRIEQLADDLLLLANRPAGDPATAATTPLAIPSPLAARRFWVHSPHLLAGDYPGALDPAAHERKLTALADLGVTRVINLMEEHEVGRGGEPFRPYIPALEAAGVVVERHPIKDVSTPSVETVKTILDAVDGAIDRGDTVYVHCWGGRGRTGVIVGCWLVRHGLASPEAALEELRRLRADCTDAQSRVPDTEEQARRIRRWRRSM